MLTLEEIKNIYKDRQSNPIGEHRFFSVLVPFVEKKGDIYLLFEVRSKTMKSQPGEICFPGGNMEKGETPTQTALRETEEETGISREKIEIIGKGDTLYGYANYTLYTTMGVIPYEEYLAAKIDRDEVEELFLIPVSMFNEDTLKVYTERIYPDIQEDFPYEKVGITKEYSWRIGTWDIPVYEINDRVIWGLTARITMQVIDVLEGKKSF